MPVIQRYVKFHASMLCIHVEVTSTALSNWFYILVVVRGRLICSIYYKSG